MTTMSDAVSITEAKAKLGELLTRAEDGDVFIQKHGHVVGVLMSRTHYTALLTELEDLEDRLSVHEREGLTMSFDKLKAELGLNED